LPLCNHIMIFYITESSAYTNSVWWNIYSIHKFVDNLIIITICRPCLLPLPTKIPSSCLYSSLRMHAHIPIPMSISEGLSRQILEIDEVTIDVSLSTCTSSYHWKNRDDKMWAFKPGRGRVAGGGLVCIGSNTRNLTRWATFNLPLLRCNLTESASRSLMGFGEVNDNMIKWLTCLLKNWWAGIHLYKNLWYWLMWYEIKWDATLVDWQYSKVLVGYPSENLERNLCLLTSVWVLGSSGLN